MLMNGVSARPWSPDKDFMNLKTDPILLTSLPAETMADRAAIQELIVTNYGKDADTLDTVASCGCGETSGNHRVGDTCLACNGKVREQHTLSSESLVWIECPEVAGQFFTPLAWEMFSSALTPNPKKSDWNGLAYICKLNYKPAPPENERAVKLQRTLDSLGFRGLNQVMENLPLLLEVIKQEGRNIKYLGELIDRYKDDLTCKYLPLPTKTAFVLQKTSLGDFTDPSLKSAMEAIQHIVALSNESKPNRIINRCVSIMEELRNYYDSVYSVIGKKPQWFRKVIYGTRLNWAWRTVITSLYGTHHYEEIKIPYSQACVLFKVHLTNRLVTRHDMSMREANEYIDRHTAQIDPFLLAQLNELVAETPNGQGFWCTLTRYPTLSRGSTQLLRITGFTNSSTELSVLVLVAPNSDTSSLGANSLIAKLNCKVFVLEISLPIPKGMMDNLLNCLNLPETTLPQRNPKG